MTALAFAAAMAVTLAAIALIEAIRVKKMLEVITVSLTMLILSGDDGRAEFAEMLEDDDE